MTDLSRRGFITSVAAVAAASAMPSVPALAEAGAPVAEIAAHPFARLKELLALPFEGELEKGAAFGIPDDEVKDLFGHRSAIDWPEGDYGVFADDHTGTLVVYRVPKNMQPQDLWSKTPHMEYRRPSHWEPWRYGDNETTEPLKPIDDDVVNRKDRPWPLASWEMY